MKRTSLLYALLLALGLSTNLAAAPSHAVPPSSQPAMVHAEWFDFVPVNSRPSRTTVVRVTALAMAFALFIMLRSKH
jgi:hypothetical protein